MINGRCVDDSCVVGGLECAGHGVCMPGIENAECHCLNNFDFATGCEECISGYHPSEGERIECVLDESLCKETPNDAFVCNGHGICGTDLLCKCYMNYTGTFCDTCVNTEFYG